MRQPFSFIPADQILSSDHRENRKETLLFLVSTNTHKKPFRRTRMSEAQGKVRAPTTIHIEDGTKYLFFGDLVAVSYKLEKDSESIKDSTGATHRVTVYKDRCPREAKKTIVFSGLRSYEDGTFLEEGCSVEGGLSAKEALELANNIADAVAFVEAGLPGLENEGGLA